VKIQVRNIRGEIVGDVEVADRVFGAPDNEAVVHQVMVGQRANARQGTASTKTRGQVSGGGAKARPQKHTGNARLGSRRSPQLRGGGTVFGPIPRSFRHHTPRKMRRLALTTLLSNKLRENQLVVVDNLELDQPKTKEMIGVLAALGVGPSVLLVADGADKATLRSARNIPRVKMLPASLLNTLDLLNHRMVLMTLDAVKKADELWSVAYIRPKRRKSSKDAEG